MSRVYEELDAAYAATCSDATLCSNTRGFFTKILEDVLDLVSEGDWMQVFEKASGDAGKISAVKNHKELSEDLSEVFSRIEPLHREKDARVSAERRKAAQQALAAGDLHGALALASQAVLRAPMSGESEFIDGGVSLALALWVRSEVLLRSERYNAAVEDLKMALKKRLPAKMRADYYWRMGNCYKGTGETTRAKVSYELAGRLLANNEEARARLNEDMKSLESAPSNPLKKNPVSEISLTAGAKQNMPALSKLVKIAEESTKGRFAVAASPIRTGDVLLVESPYAACLLPDCYGTHCLHCFKRLESCVDEAIAWCPKCSGVAFCSLKCRDTAVSTYHKYECQFSDLFIGSGMSILSYIALRMVTQAGLEVALAIHSKYMANEVQTVQGTSLNDIEGSSKKTKMKSRKERLNRTKKAIKTFETVKEESDTDVRDEDEKVVFEESLELKAAQIYSLCCHSEQRKPEDYLKRTVMAMFLTECLKKAEFFGKCASVEDKKREDAICELLLRNLQLLQFNAHEIYETVRGSHTFSGSKSHYIAVGIYPTGALFNHECYPAVARYFEGRKIVLRAVRPLKPGAVVAENYGPHLLTRSLKERQRTLACRYWFRCNCTACLENWPMLKEMGNNSNIALRCPNEECLAKIRASPQWPSRCPKCNTNIDKRQMSSNLEILKECLTQYQEGARHMEEENAKEAIDVLSQSVDSFYEVACCPHKETHLAQESLRSCYAIFGNVHIAQEKKGN